MSREELYKLNDELRWKLYSERVNLRNCESTREDVKFYIKEPLELQKKYVDVLDYANRYMMDTFDSIEHFFKYSKLLRKEIHSRIAKLKKERKEVKDKLSRLPKIKS
jgi:outer membrane phospholipase A